MVHLHGRTIRCARALCSRDLFRKPLSPCSSLSFSSKEEGFHSQIPPKSSRPQSSVEDYRFRTSKPLRESPSAPQDTFFYWPPPSSASFQSASSDDEENHRRSSVWESLPPSDDEENARHSRVLRPLPASNTISVFWDLDNKPPHSVPPYEAAIRLREVACGFGRLVDMVAYANRHAFSYIPSWVREERRSRKELDRLEASGLVVPGEPYVCGYCGRRCKTNVALKKHFKQLHERERNKRLRRLDCLKGKKKIKYKESLIEKETKYREAARDIITPKVGYGLMQELKRAGVWVKMVSDRPQAADEALMEHMSQSIRTGIKCICLVSDDSDFVPVLHEARAQSLHTVVVGDRPRLKMFADIQFSWSDLASGRAFDKATELASMWYGKEGTGMTTLQTRRRVMPVGLKHFPTQSHDFQEWGISDHSDVEPVDPFDADSGLEESSDAWVIEDDVVDVLDDDNTDSDASC